jgi:hypothetical protein
MLRTQGYCCHSRAQPSYESLYSVIHYLGVVTDIFHSNCLVAIVEGIRINRPKSEN